MKKLNEYLTESRDDFYYVVPEYSDHGRKMVEMWIGPYSYKDEAESDAIRLQDQLENDKDESMCPLIGVFVYDAEELSRLLKKLGYGSHTYSARDIENSANSRSYID